MERQKTKTRKRTHPPTQPGATVPADSGYKLIRESHQGTALVCEISLGQANKIPEETGDVKKGRKRSIQIDSAYSSDTSCSTVHALRSPIMSVHASTTTAAAAFVLSVVRSQSTGGRRQTTIVTSQSLIRNVRYRHEHNTTVPHSEPYHAAPHRILSRRKGNPQPARPRRTKSQVLSSFRSTPSPIQYGTYTVN